MGLRKFLAIWGEAIPNVNYSVIGKKSVINRLNSISKGESREGALFLKSNEPSTHGINNKDIEERGEGTTLPYPLIGFEKLCGSSVD